jgi:anti-sigma factor RsiW
VNQGCEQFETLLPEWADGSLSAKAAPGLEDHLADCPACRVSALEQREVHDLLRARGGDLRESAPASLRARLERPSTARVVPFFRSSQPVTARRPAWRLAAAAALALAIVGASALAPGGTLLAAQLALDHLKCQWLAREADGQQPAALEQEWAAAHGWPIDIPPSHPTEHVTLTGLRRCLFHGGSMAHVHYRHGETPISLFILQGPREAAASLAIMGQQTVSWSDATHTYALVGPMSDTALAAIASRFQEDLR